MLSNGVLRSGNSGLAAKFCLEEPIWPPMPKEGVTQWWGGLASYTIGLMIWPKLDNLSELSNSK